MLNTSYFTVIFMVLALTIIGVLSILNKNSTPLRKSWNIYTAMYILHAILFLGVMIMLPFTLKSLPLERHETDEIKTIKDVKEKLKEQREDIEEIRNQLDQTTQTIFTLSLIFLMIAPIIYYNLFKYNLEIEKLSGKRMGSFD